VNAMSNLKSFLWNNKTSTSIKNKYTNKTLALREWPDFGFVGCPGEYITMSAYLVKQNLTFKELQTVCAGSTEDINHFLYVCQMLQILEVSEITAQPDSSFKVMKSKLGQKLKALFFERQVA
jgi:hypothetical protein